MNMEINSQATDDQLRAEVERLRTENKKLKTQLRNEKREEFPSDLLEKHPDLKWLNQPMAQAVSLLALSVVERFESSKITVTCKNMEEDQYVFYIDLINMLLSVLEYGCEGMKNSTLASCEAENDIARLAECVYDLSIQAEQFMQEQQIRPDDSRDLYGSIYYWAEEFEKNFDADEQDYYEEIEKYGEKRLQKYFDL